tara:strand:- start:40 stop:414 length:375 start_codon:yes stop_codon:yes gene_type:complete
MCTEFFLACLYFLILSVINFFLLKLLNVYLKNIFQLNKIKNISRIYPNNQFFRKLYKYSDKNYQNSKTLSTFNIGDMKNIDPLIIGNIYRYLSANNLLISKKKSNDFYFQLLQNQYLSVEINLK